MPDPRSLTNANLHRPGRTNSIRLLKLDTHCPCNTLDSLVSLSRDICLRAKARVRMGKLRVLENQVHGHFRHANRLFRLQLGAGPGYLYRAVDHGTAVPQPFQPILTRRTDKVQIRTLNMSLKRKVQASIVFLFSGLYVTPYPPTFTQSILTKF